VPIALDHVETGAWLQKRDAGILVRDPIVDLASLFGRLDDAGYAAERARLDQISLDDLITRREDCDALAAALRGQAQ